MTGASLIKVIFMPRHVPSPHLPVEYYVETSNYKTAEDVARAQLIKDKAEHQCYDQVVLTAINPLAP